VGQVDAGDVSAPARLNSDRYISQFNCGQPELDDWLKRRALQSEESGASRTYAACIGRQVVGYCALANGAAAHADAPGRVKRNMPNPIPVMAVARLAVDLRFQGRRIGSALLRDAVLRTVQAAEIAGIRAILVHAIDERAKRFYEKSGFATSPTDPMTLMIALRAAAHTLAEES
jgi:GNAT superfamily N-acetyltransferase